MSSVPQPSDPWLISQDRPTGMTPKAGHRSDSLKVEIIEGIEPLDAQIGVFPKKTVPAALYDALFGQLAPTAAEAEAAGGEPSAVQPIKTYAILDAAKITNLPELLEDSGLEHRCLFKGTAYDDLKNVAPWLVRLEEGNTFTRNLFTRSDAPWHLWDNEPGIYARSRGSLDDMWKHFRKFTKIQDETGKWFYFRFWEPRAAHRTFDALPLTGVRSLFANVKEVYAVTVMPSSVVRRFHLTPAIQEAPVPCP